MKGVVAFWMAAVWIGVEPRELQVLTAGDVAGSAALESYLKGLAREAFARRGQRYEALKTPADCRAYQKRLREFFLRRIGGLPARTPLHAQVVDKLEAEHYRVEKIIYESRPNHHVTAALYLPEGKPPFPAVLIPCGHSISGKAAPSNQRMCILLAKNGLAALCYDPIGQGERSQLLTPEGKRKHGSTTEHTLVGVGAILLGTNTAQYRIYDGIRGIDYLVSRPEIDGRRIGCAGCSGGGTLTSYIMALDDRVTCAAPACYLTTFQRLIETIGPQDAEQNIAGQIAIGLDQTDYVLMRAPKPTLIVSTTRDFFDITGTWANFRQAKRFYARLGFPERVDLVEDDWRHGVTKLNRATLAHWMRRWLLGQDVHVEEPELELWSEQQLQCTPKGQVMLLPGERSAFELNVELAEQLAAERKKFLARRSATALRAAIRTAANIRQLDLLPEPRVLKRGTSLGQRHRIEKLLIEPEPGLLVPALYFVPANVGRDLVLYAPESGKASAAGPDESVRGWLEQGQPVLAVDLPGLGETRVERGGALGQYCGDWKNAFLAYLLDKPMVAIRAESLMAVARWAASYQAAAGPRRVHLVATGECGVPALHAAALEPELFASVRLIRTLQSWELVVRTPEARNQLINTVHGALSYYDLPDLVALAGKERVQCEQPADATGKPLQRP